MEGRLFRSRLTKEFDERTAQFHTSIFDDLRIFEDDIDGTEAHDIMLHEQGIIPLEALKLILSALEEIREEWLRGEVEIGAEFEDIHEFVETKVIEKIGIEAGGMLHTGRSRNDQVVVDIRLRVREELLESATKVLGLVSSMLEKAENHVDTLMMLYTHGQHAQIGSFSHYLTAYTNALLRDYQRLLECYSRVNRNPLGAGPVGGTSINIDRRRTTELLGFNGLVENSIDATSGRDWAIETAAVCSIIMSDLSRMAADLILWSTSEFGFVELADEYASSSSIMPQKKNPSTLELVRGKTGEVYGALMELLTMVKGVPSGYFQDLQGTKPPLWRCIDTVKTCLVVMTGVVSTLKVNEARMREITEGSLTVAVDFAERLVEEAGLPFREAYRLVANLIKATLERGMQLQDLTPAAVMETSTRILGKRIEVEQDFIKNMTSQSSIHRRKSQGSPNPKLVETLIREQRIKLEEGKDILESRMSGLTAAKALLRETIEDYLSI